MRLTDSLTIAEFGSYRIKALYYYRIEVPYENKHDGPDITDIQVEKIELKIEEALIRKGAPLWAHFRTITLLDIPPWMWELLNSTSVLGELDRDIGPDPDEQRDAQQDAAFEAAFQGVKTPD
jgi:hypothetical protein